MAGGTISAGEPRHATASRSDAIQQALATFSQRGACIKPVIVFE